MEGGMFMGQTDEQSDRHAEENDEVSSRLSKLFNRVSKRWKRILSEGLKFNFPSLCSFLLKCHLFHFIPLNFKMYNNFSKLVITVFTFLNTVREQSNFQPRKKWLWVKTKRLNLFWKLNHICNIDATLLCLHPECVENKKWNIIINLISLND